MSQFSKTQRQNLREVRKDLKSTKREDKRSPEVKAEDQRMERQAKRKVRARADEIAAGHRKAQAHKPPARIVEIYGKLKKEAARRGADTYSRMLMVWNPRKVALWLRVRGIVEQGAAWK